MKIHMIGIGGLGMSALARLYVHRGYNVSGQDLSSSKVSNGLEKLGITIMYGQHDIGLIESDTDLVVYSNALVTFNPEFLDQVYQLDIASRSYPQALGEITKEYTTVCVAGTHGKTTTTAMTLHILSEAGVSPTGIVGSLLASSGSNFVSGDSNILIIEADEYMKAFLHHSPSVVGVTNIDHDHHDVYQSLDDMKDTFRQLGENIPDTGALVISTLDQNSWDTFDDLARNIIDYSSVDVADLNLKVPGAFNRRNAQLAIALTGVLGVSEADAKKALESFTGTWRRQEYKGKAGSGQMVYDDYAHHPTEVAASVAGFKDMFPGKKITIVFQPHLYSRTKELFDDFVNAFANSTIHQLILVPVYAARELPDPTATSEILANTIADKSDINVVSMADFDSATNAIDGETDVIITMGAGDITTLSDRLVA